MAKISLSKSQFTRGVQCHKSFWLYRNKPELRAEPDAATKARFDAGHEVGILAQQLFPDGTLIEFDRDKFREKLKETQAAIASGVKTIYEAAFSYNDVLILADILHKGKRGWELYEVKSSTEVKDYHVPDTAVQYYVINGAGLKVVNASVVHFNNEYVREGGLNVKSCSRSLISPSKCVTCRILSVRNWLSKKCSPRGCLTSTLDHTAAIPMTVTSGMCAGRISPADSVLICVRRVPTSSNSIGRDRQTKDIPLDALNVMQRFQVESTLKKKNKVDTVEDR
jgi:hypothetical protein